MIIRVVEGVVAVVAALAAKEWWQRVGVAVGVGAGSGAEEETSARGARAMPGSRVGVIVPRRWSQRRVGIPELRARQRQRTHDITILILLLLLL